MKSMAMKNTNILWLIALLAIGALFLGTTTGCGGDDDDDDDNDADGMAGDDDDDDDMAPMANIRAIHLSPDAPAVDIYVNGAILAFPGLAFPDGTDYAALDEGTYDIDITAEGAPVADSVLTVSDLALSGDTYYTAVAYDELAGLSAMALVDDLSDPGAGNIRVRAIHTAIAVGQVDIWEVSDPDNPAVLYENVDFGVAGDYLTVPAGSYTLGFDVDDDAVPDVTFVTPDLPAGTVANVFAVSQGDDVFLIAQLDGGTTAQIDPE